MHFTPCKSRDDCNYNETHCLSCRRSIEEINAVRELTSDLALRLNNMINKMQYDNPDEFVSYVLRKTEKKLK